MKKTLVTICVALASTLSCAFVMGGCSHTHELTKVSAVAATCEEDGNSEYYTCNCGKFFEDKDATKEIKENSWVIEAINHDYQPTEWHDAAHQHVKKQVCTNDSTHVIETNFVNVTPATLNSTINASSLADRNWESYNLNLAAGNYDCLSIDYANKTNLGDGTASSPFVYKRVINSLQLVGEDKATTKMNGLNFKDGFFVLYPDSEPYYYVYKTYEIDTLLVKNITFTDKVHISSLINTTYYANATINIKNVIFENVKFDMTGVTFANAPLHIQSYNKEIENVIVKDCEFINCTGTNANAIAIDVKTTDDINITIEGCKFDNIAYNAIQIAGTGNCYVGTITIKNNEIKNTGSRALRIGVLGTDVTKKGKLIVENNIMINASNSSGEILKCKVDADAVVVINNNYWGAIDGATAIKGLVNDATGGANILDSNPRTSAE
jgi:hypothetical protein